MPDHDAQTRLTEAAPPPGSTAADWPSREGPGSSVGPYRLMEMLGQGGFGQVFLAEQDKPVKRRVALKIIKLGMDTRAVIARFDAERQALALMDHPNIARVLDAGATETGRPYFVMELVRGVPITEFCDSARLGVHERLELFQKVCHAVQHAHQKGIIHRDIKPSNVLVTAQQGGPTPKVIDFGIAKATAGRLTDHTLYTERRELIGTPEYMSPEQADPSSGDIDTRADIYSLGALLYELLTGLTPFDGARLRSAALGDIQKIIREQDPERPSTRIGTALRSGARRSGSAVLDSTPTAAEAPKPVPVDRGPASAARLAPALDAIASRRGTEPRALLRSLRGDLDWVVMKAMEKDRVRRYETAGAFAEDIARHLAGRPVLAAPPSLAYTARKFVRRHRLAVAAGTAVAAALLAGLGIAAVGFVSAVRSRDAETVAKIAAQNDRTIAEQARGTAERRREEADAARGMANEQRRLAEISSKKAEAINQFLLDMLGSANLREEGREAKVSQALDKASETVGTAFADRPAVEAAVRAILGRTYVSLGMLDQAEPHIKRALELNGTLYGPDSLEVGKSLGDMGFLTSQRGRPEEALTFFQRSADISLAKLGPDDPRVLGDQSELANALREVGRKEEAEKILRRTLEARTRIVGRDDVDTQILVNSLAVLLHDEERLDEAEVLYREAAETAERLHGPDHPDALTTRLNLASLLRSRGNDDAALAMMEETLPRVRRVFGDKNVKTASAARNLGSMYEHLGRMRDALPLFREAVEVRRAAQGDQTIDVAEAKSELANVLRRMGESGAAAETQAEVVATYLTLRGDEDRKTLEAQVDLANYLEPAGKTAEAEALFKRLLEVTARVLGPDDRMTIVATNSYAVLLQGQDRLAEAEPLYRAALEKGRRAYGDDHRDTIITLYNLAGVERELGHLDEAESLSRDCVAKFEVGFGKNHPNTAQVMRGRAKTLALLKRYEEAIRLCERSLEIDKAALGERHATVGWDLDQIGVLLMDSGDAAGAEAKLREAVAILRERGGDANVRTANAAGDLGRCLTHLKRYAEAEALLQESQRTLEKDRGADHKDTRTVEMALSDLYRAWNEAEPDAARAGAAAEWKQRAEQK